jgi:hypothetical protein
MKNNTLTNAIRLLDRVTPAPPTSAPPYSGAGNISDIAFDLFPRILHNMAGLERREAHRRSKNPLPKGEKLSDKVEAQRYQNTPRLVRSFFKAPDVSYITDF